MANGMIGSGTEVAERSKYDSELGEHIQAVMRLKDTARRLNSELFRIGTAVLGSEPLTPEKGRETAPSVVPNGLSQELRVEITELGELMDEADRHIARLARLG